VGRKKWSQLFVVGLLLCSHPPTLPATAAENEVVAIRAGQILPIAGEPIRNGVILIREGKIAEIGPGVAIPEGAKVIDARTKVVLPGLVVAYTTLAEQGDDLETMAPEVRALDGYDLFQPRPRLLAGGITTIYVSPGQRRLIGGQGAVVKTAGEDVEKRVLKATSGLRVTLGEASKNPPALFEPPIPPTPEEPIEPEEKQFPTTRPSAFALLRRAFSEAARPKGQAQDWPQDPQDRARRAMKLQVLQEALLGQRPLRVHAQTAADIRAALRWAEEFGLTVILEGATEGYKVAEDLARRDVPVIVNGFVRPGQFQPEDLTRERVNGEVNLSNAALLAAAGVPVALHAPDDDELPNLLLIAGYAIQHGLSAETALRAITLTPAEILDVADRVGSLEVGKDADLLILDGPPFDLRTRVEMTLVEGQVVYQRGPDEPGPKEEEPLLTAIRAGRILTVTRGTIEDGVILVRGGKIQYVGPEIALPPEAEVIDARGSVVLPGLIDLHSHLGLHVDREPETTLTQGVPGDVTSGRASGRVRLSRAVAPGDEAFQEGLRGGVTTILLAPGRGATVAGQAVALKLAGETLDEMIVKDPAALKFSLLGGSARLAQKWNLRDLLKQAQSYQQSWKNYARARREYERDLADWEAKTALAPADGPQTAPPKEPREPAVNEDLEPFKALLEGKLPALVEARRADEILTALRVLRDEFKLDVILLGADDGFRVRDELARRDVGVAIGPTILQRIDGEEVNNAARLAEAGLKIAFHTSATSGTQFLRLTAGWAVRYGLDPVEALRAVTIYPARLLHLDDRLGSLEKGKDADLVFLSGDPFALTSRVERVMVNGRVVFEGE